MAPTFLIFLWVLIGLPSMIAGSVLTIVAIYGRRLWRLHRRRQAAKARSPLIV
jgi:uncharacterized membrane protein